MAGKTRITSKQKSARCRNIKIAQSSRKRAGGAFKKGYKRARKSGYTKRGAYEAGLRSAMKASPRAGTKLAKSFAKGYAKKHYKHAGLSKKDIQGIANRYPKNVKRKLGVHTLN